MARKPEQVSFEEYFEAAERERLAVIEEVSFEDYFEALENAREATTEVSFEDYFERCERERAEMTAQPYIPNRAKKLGSVPVRATPLLEPICITQSFERPVVPINHHTRADRIGMLVDDVRDNLPSDYPPLAVEYVGIEASKLLDRLLPRTAERAVRRLGSNYEDGELYYRFDNVGDKEQGTNHTHFYFMDQTRSGVTRMYFVDPEHLVAKRNMMRPSIVNLVGLEVPDDGVASPMVAILRYRVPEYDYQDKPVGMDRESLRLVIEQVLDNGGSLPKELQGERERDVLFMMAATGSSSRVQARYSYNSQINSFAQGDKGSSALEGKVQVQVHVLNKLIRLFNQRSHAKQRKSA